MDDPSSEAPDPGIDDDDDPSALGGDQGEARSLTLRLGEDVLGRRFDKALADAAAETAPELALSRSRLAALLADGRVSWAGRTLLDGSEKVKEPGDAKVLVPPPAPIEPKAEAIPLTVLFEDDQVIVVVKPAGMAAHPAPGAPSGTLVNALLHHCGDSLSGIGGALRPGIVHRLDKDTSGVMVAAKTDAAAQGLSTAFAAHAVERRYAALCWRAPDPADPRIAGLSGVSAEPGALRVETGIARHRTDRKRMAVSASGKRAVSRFEILQRHRAEDGALIAARIACRLETGRTHQIRVHAAHLGCGLLGDPTYGRAMASAATRLGDAAAAALAALGRQALHAETLGFDHPITGEALRFESPPPADFQRLADALDSAFPDAAR